jgi:hypothetical protein
MVQGGSQKVDRGQPDENEYSLAPVVVGEYQQVARLSQNTMDTATRAGRKASHGCGQRRRRFTQVRTCSGDALRMRNLGVTF